LYEYAGVPLAQLQKQLTPLQRMVIVKEVKRQKEEAENNTHQSGPTMNSAAGAGGVPASGGGGMSGQTIEYVNEGAD
jgi:hypothetical protein